MGTTWAGLAVLASAKSQIALFVSVFLYVYMAIILIYVISRWVQLPYSVWLSRVQGFLFEVSEPYLRIFRRVVPQLGPLDLSPLVAVIVLQIAVKLVQTLLS